MADMLSKHSASFIVNVNDTPSTYSSTYDDITITINTATGSVASGTVEKETNFLLDVGNPNPVVQSLLTLTYSNAGASSFIGFRISAAAADTNYTFTTTDNTTFEIPQTLPGIGLSSSSPDANNTIWQKAAATHTADGTIPIAINYLGTALPATNPLAITVDFFVMATSTDYANATKVSVTTDDASPANNLEILVVTAEVTSSLTSSAPTALGTPVTTFNFNDKIALNDLFTVNATTNYKPVNSLTFVESINKAVTLNYLYISVTAASSIDLDNNKLMDAGSNEVTATDYTAINLANLTDTGVTITDDTENPGSKTVTVVMGAIAETTKFFTDNNLTSPIYVYIQGTINGAPQTA